ncbi:MAG: hypothetical protein GY827_03125 [Cytophagales bacterium]|nr:hypothetical protein [Cytophagales bacterium]
MELYSLKFDGGIVVLDIYLSNTTEVTELDFRLKVGDNKVMNVVSDYDNTSMFNVYEEVLLFTGFGFEEATTTEPILSVQFDANSFDENALSLTLLSIFLKKK